MVGQKDEIEQLNIMTVIFWGIPSNSDLSCSFLVSLKPAGNFREAVHENWQRRLVKPRLREASSPTEIRYRWIIIFIAEDRRLRFLAPSGKNKITLFRTEREPHGCGHEREDQPVNGVDLGNSGGWTGGRGRVCTELSLERDSNNSIGTTLDIICFDTLINWFCEKL